MLLAAFFPERNDEIPMSLEMVLESGKVARSESKIIPLILSTSGQWVRIHSLPAGIIRSQFIRFGLNEGERIRCIERLPGGTIVIQKNRQQIAIGHLLAAQIFVAIIPSKKK